ncbi:MAG: TonB-dependent receptor plug domain-containing protein [Candidatus Kapaibacterium sp.]
MRNIFLLILFLGIPAALVAQNMQSGHTVLDDESMYGFIKDKKTHEPIAGATIDVLTKDRVSLRKQRTNVSGAFRVKYEEMNVGFISITALGYQDTIIAMPHSGNIVVLLTEKPLLGEEITVTAQKHTTFSQDVPISISIVKAKEITERSPESIDYSLRYIPGVSVTESQVSIRGSSGYARSVGSRVLFLLDGMPYLSADNGDIKFDALPIMNIDRIEVVKGAGSALYGSSALGGVINVITRKPSDSLRGALSANIGEYDQVKYPEWRIPSIGRKFASLEGGLTGTVGETGLLGSFAVRRNEGYRLGDDSYKSSGFAKMTNPLSDHDRLETSLLLANENHGGFLFWKDLGHALMPSDSLGAVNGRIHSFKAHLQSSLQSILSDHFILTSRANIHYTDFSTDPSQAGDPPGAHAKATNYDLEFEGNSDFLKSVYLTTGVSGIYQTVSSDLYQSHHGLTISGFAQAEYRLLPLIFT